MSLNVCVSANDSLMVYSCSLSRILITSCPRYVNVNVKRISTLLLSLQPDALAPQIYAPTNKQPRTAILLPPSDIVHGFY